MRFLLIFLIIQLTVTDAYSTAQVPDILIYKGKKVSIFNNPLEVYYSDENRPEYILGPDACISSACWRGYVATWEISDGKFYLKELKSFCYKEDNIKADLKTLFGDKFQNRKVLADWYSGDLVIPKGKLLYYDHMGYESVYKKEIVIKIKKGEIIQTKKYNNSKTRLKYLDSDKLSQKIIKNLDSEILKKIDSELKVYCDIESTDGNVTSAQVIETNYPEITDELIRIIENIDDWDILYRHGKEVRLGWYFPIIINTESIKKYGR